jgi:hypothetical protein
MRNPDARWLTLHASALDDTPRERGGVRRGTDRRPAILTLQRAANVPVAH